MKLLPTLLETLLRCQQPRRRPHLEAAKPKQAGANWSSLHLDFSPGPTCPSPSYTPDPFLLHILSGLSWLSVKSTRCPCHPHTIASPMPESHPWLPSVLTTEHTRLCQAFLSSPWKPHQPFLSSSVVPPPQAAWALVQATAVLSHLKTFSDAP